MTPLVPIKSGGDYRGYNTILRIVSIFNCLSQDIRFYNEKNPDKIFVNNDVYIKRLKDD